MADKEGMKKRLGSIQSRRGREVNPFIIDDAMDPDPNRLVERFVKKGGKRFRDVIQQCGN